MAEYHNQSKLRFWCQMVLPLVYDDSLSYMELLNKVVSYLNNCIQDVGNCETNIESLLEAFVNLQNYVNEIAEDISPLIEEKIDEMIESGEFGEILADALATVVSPEYDSSKSYVPLNYAIKDGQLYCCTANTTGDWDSTKWRETTVGDELNTLMQRVFALNAGQVYYDESATYSSGTVGNKLKNLSANDIAYNSSVTYNDATVGKELSNLNGAINDRIIQLPRYTDSGELNSIVNYLKTQIATNSLYGKTVTCYCKPNDNVGYYGTSSFWITACYSDAKYGSGFMNSDYKGAVSFRTANNVNTLHPITTEITALNGAISSEATTRANADTALQNALNFSKTINFSTSAITSPFSGSSGNISDARFTADHRLIGYQFYTDQNQTTPTAETLIDIVTTTSSGSVNVAGSRFGTAGSVVLMFGKMT